MQAIFNIKSVIVGIILGAAFVAVVRAAPADPIAHNDPMRHGRFTYQTFNWEAGKQPTKMIKADEGFCYLSSITGALDGGGETARLYVGEDGFWYLGGETANGFLNLTATAVRLR